MACTPSPPLCGRVLSRASYSETSFDVPTTIIAHRLVRFGAVCSRREELLCDYHTKPGKNIVSTLHCSSILAYLRLLACSAEVFGGITRDVDHLDSVQSGELLGGIVTNFCVKNSIRSTIPWSRHGP